MAQATQAAFDTRAGETDVEAELSARLARAAVRDIRLSICDSLASAEHDWRAFERTADCTAFQSFAWLSTWQRHIGALAGVRPAIVTGRDTDGAILFLLPLAVEAHGGVRRLTWLGSELGDYNAPLLAPDFAGRVAAGRFLLVWHEITQRLHGHPELHYDLVHFEKMPAMVGAQRNPFMDFSVAINPSGAYLTGLSDNWETFYAGKRSADTRRNDRKKRKRLGEFGEVQMVTPENADEVASSLDTLMQQKGRQFAGMGVGNIFQRPGYADFYRALATEPDNRALVHVSRLDIGSAPAAVNLGLTFRGCYYHVLASYDDGPASRFGPGAAHLHELMAYAIERGCRTFDFTIGDERYKRDWCDTELTLYDHVGIATWRGALAALPLLAGRAVKRFIKQTPALWNAFCRLRVVAGSLRAR